MPQLLNEKVRERLSVVFEGDLANIYVHEKEKAIICEIKVGYIPIDDFQHIFSYCTSVVKARGIQKFIMDKRKLRAFHQPSMEWYFLTWKQEMYKVGLKVYRKILPDELWFRKCVEAGTADILKDERNNVIDQLDIQYTESVTEALLI